MCVIEHWYLKSPIGGISDVSYHQKQNIETPSLLSKFNFYKSAIEVNKLNYCFKFAQNQLPDSIMVVQQILILPG
jgi:hypothetical protein